jgi:hypothetical protein
MVVFRGFNDTAEANSAVSMTPRKGLPWFQCDPEVASVVSMRPPNPYKNFNIIFFRQIGSFQHKTMSEKFFFRGFNDTAEADSAV